MLILIYFCRWFVCCAVLQLSPVIEMTESPQMFNLPHSVFSQNENDDDNDDERLFDINWLVKCIFKTRI